MTNLYIDHVEYNVQKFGPGIGAPSLFISIGEKEAIDDDNPTDGKALYSQLLNHIKNNKLDTVWNLALNGSQKVYLVFEDSIMIKDGHFSVWDEFYTQISQESATIQKALYEKTPQNLRPPFTCWIGNPTMFSSQKQFYEYFNMCLASISTEDKYNDLALQELLNHTFSNVIVHVKDETEYEELFVKLTDKFKSIPSHKLRVVTGDNAVMEKCLKNCVKVEGPAIYAK